MGTLIGAAILLAIIFLPSIIREYKFDNRLPPSGYRTDHDEMNKDLTLGMSRNDVKDKFNRGGYDVKK